MPYEESLSAEQLAKATIVISVQTATIQFVKILPFFMTLIFYMLKITLYSVENIYPVKTLIKTFCLLLTLQI